jgi:hypothetical protein
MPEEQGRAKARLLASMIATKMKRMAAAGLPDGVVDCILDSASDEQLDLGKLWARLRDLRRLRVDVSPIRRRDFDQDRRVFGELAEAVAREGRLIHGRWPRV